MPLAGPGCWEGSWVLGRETACARHTEHKEGLAGFAQQRFPLPIEEQDGEAEESLLWALAQLPDSPEDTGWLWSVSARGKSIIKSRKKKRGEEKKRCVGEGKEVHHLLDEEAPVPGTANLQQKAKGFDPGDSEEK